MQTVNLAYQKDLGPHLNIQEASWFWVTMEYFGDEIFPVLTGHLFCCNIPEWAWDIGWGARDEYDLLPVSLGHYMWQFGQYLTLGFNAYKYFRKVGDVPLTVFEVHELFPDADPIFTGDSADAMNYRPDDEKDM
jgi:hypothetical protein